MKKEEGKTAIWMIINFILQDATLQGVVTERLLLQDLHLSNSRLRVDGSKKD